MVHADKEEASLEKEVIDIVANQLGVDKSELALDKAFVEDLNADSLDLTELIMAFEDRYKCEIPDEEAEKLKTIQDVVHYIKTQKAL